MPTRLITLQAWADAIYGNASPKIATLRAWAKTGKISPAPQKHGRSYFVAPDARYVSANDATLHGDAKPIVEKISHTAAPKERAADKIERMIRERKAQQAARKRQP
jgi:hypothetical protein